MYSTPKEQPHQCRRRILTKNVGRYLLARLKTLCEEAIRTSITVETVCTIFLLAHKHNAEGLKV